ncbi:MAG: hypothetical protein H0X29_07095 [Parachlamydiaceae bacterium]|nr:hypothetical protein [Parachlamydiaceae bacterium]
MFSSIPQKRLLLYLLLAGLVPIFFGWLTFSSQLDSVSNLENNILQVQSQAFSRENKQSINMAVKQHYSDADHFYIDKNLESITLLEPEIDSLKNLTSNPNFNDDENVKKRFESLFGPANRLSFTEGVVQSSPAFQEVTETLVHPVEINVNDLRHILCLIEGIPIGNCTPAPNRPQLIVLDFKIDKKSVSEKNEVYLLNLKLLKREFL